MLLTHTDGDEEFQKRIKAGLEVHSKQWTFEKIHECQNLIRKEKPIQVFLSESRLEITFMN